MIAYISGKITDDPDYRRKFANAETVMMNLGYSVLNPASLPDGLDYDQYMRVDLALIDVSDLVVMLPDWKSSCGANRERRHAIESGKRVEYYEQLIKKRIIDMEDEEDA